VLDTIFPRTCPGCDEVAALDEDIWCYECALELSEAVGRAYCPACGVDVGPYTTSDDRCFRCRDTKLHYERFVRVGPYEGLLRDLIIGYKFGRRTWLDRAMARLLSDALIGRGGAGDVDAFVPIPSRSHGRHGRPHRPVTQLASQVASMLDRPALPLLTKRRNVRPQRGLSATARWENIRGAFQLARGARPEGTTLCLIDDIATTGATLHEAANTLRAAGAKTIRAAVLARTDPDKLSWDQ